MKKDKQFVVIGIGRFGRSVATTLYQLGYEVLAIDSSERDSGYFNEVTHAVQIDAKDEEALKIRYRNFDVAIVGIGDDNQSNILVSVMLKEIWRQNRHSQGQRCASWQGS
jgi:trk system potassium uptake protein TrkA